MTRLSVFNTLRYKATGVEPIKDEGISATKEGTVILTDYLGATVKSSTGNAIEKSISTSGSKISATDSLKRDFWTNIGAAYTNSCMNNDNYTDTDVSKNTISFSNHTITENKKADTGVTWSYLSPAATVPVAE